MKKIQYIHLVFCVSFLQIYSTYAQVLTKEDSLSAGLIQTTQATVLSGYGSMHYQNNLSAKEAEANIDRVVLFFGHKFSKKIFFFSELEIEDAKIEGSDASGEFALEQAFIKFQLTRHSYLTTGLFIPRIGIINENHLPNTFNGVQRPVVETYIIPSTWREIGIGYYAISQRIAGLNFSAALVNGLNAAAFENGSGIREGRAEGRNAQANCLALTGSLLYYNGPWRLQTAVYYGGSTAMSPNMADSLNLNSGPFGTPVGLIDFNLQYHAKRWAMKALATSVILPDASRINAAFDSNTPQQMTGAYAELAYDIWKNQTAVLRAFGRFEYLDMNNKIPANGTYHPELNQKYLIAGLSYLPIHGVVVKMDFTRKILANQYQNFVNFGVGFSF